VNQRTARLWGVSRGALALGRKQLGEQLPLTVLFGAVGATLADLGQHLLIAPVPMLALWVCLNAAVAALAVAGIRRAPRRPNRWALLAYLYFAGIIMIGIAVYQRDSNLTHFAILNAAALFLIADRRYLLATQLGGAMMLLAALPALHALSGWHSGLLTCAVIWAIGIAIHRNRIAVWEETQNTRAALRRESVQRRKAEALSLLAGKREKLGTLAGTVAHDFNNHLTVIRGALELAEDPSMSATHRARALQMALESTEQAQGQCRSLLQEVRGQTVALQPVNLCDLASQALRHAQAIADPGIKLVLDPGPDAPVVMGDPERLRQAVINLIVNGAEAARSQVQVRVFRDQRGDRTLAGVSVADDGTGIPEVLRDRLFDAHITTKTGGSGLGLASVAHTARSHGGEIAVESSGAGARFNLLFPASDNVSGLQQAPTENDDRLSEADIASIDPLFANVFDQLPHLVFLKDKRNNHLRVNLAVANLRALDRRALENRPSKDTHPDEADAYYRDDLEVIDSGKAKLGIIEPIEVSPGKKAQYCTDKHPWYAANGSLLGILVICRPVSGIAAGTDADDRAPQDSRFAATHSVPDKNTGGKLALRA
jgi:signal transduction histidine kinase